ncbi:15168_t:CDS:2 [Entrophospora sp. SA101]|nr:15168_t:CDS:2 [Entrophospora sp. SA101]
MTENFNQENTNPNLQIEENSTYPLVNNITYKERVNNQTKRSFSYVIIKEGVYPEKVLTGPKSKNSVISRKKRSIQQYKIPHNYIVETTWGRAANKRTVRCKINYVDGIPQFCIEYGFNFQNVIFSTKSPSDAALNYERALKPGTKATISGPLVFGLQLNSVQKAREARRRGHLIKPANNCVQSTLEKRAKKIAERTQVSFNNNVKEIYHESDKVMLKEIEFTLNDMDFQVNYGYEQEKKNHQIQSIVKAVDQGQISRCSYQNLAAAEYNLPRLGSVSDERTAITNYMNQIIKISLVDIKKINEPEESIESEEEDIVDLEIIQKVIDTMGIGIRRSAKDILCYIIPQLQKQQILKSSDPTIHLLKATIT